MPVRERADLEVMPIHHLIAGFPQLKWGCEAQIETQDIDEVASNYSQDTIENTLRLPLEILAIIAEYLTLSSSHGTCASLAITSHAVLQETTPVLWKTITAWNPPRYPAGDSAEDEALVREMFERWNEMMNANAAKYTEYILVPPFAFDTEHKSMFITDDYAFSAESRLVFPRLKALVYFDESRPGPRLVLAQPYLHICAGFEPGTDDVEGVLRLLSMAPGVLGQTLIRPPWTFTVPESTTSAAVRKRKEEDRLLWEIDIESDDGDEEWEDVDDVDDGLLSAEDLPPEFQRISDIAAPLSSDTDHEYEPDDDTPKQYAPLTTSELSKPLRKRLTDCFPYPLTVIEYTTPLLDRPDPDLVASTFVDLLRLAMSISGQGKAIKLSFRGLVMDEVIGCVESYQPLLLIHPEYATLKLEFQIRDTSSESDSESESEPSFSDSVHQIFADIRAGLYAIYTRFQTPLETMGSFIIARQGEEEIEERWFMRVLPLERMVAWGTGDGGPESGGWESTEPFPGEGEDAFTRLKEQYAVDLAADVDEPVQRRR